MKNNARLLALALSTLATASIGAAPIGYSVNSDEPSGDNLFSIDLANGQEQLKGKVQSLGVTRTDVEGLAFDNFGVLWGMDDESLRLFPINTTTGAVLFSEEMTITGLGATEGNDFGMAFTCAGDLFATSVSTQSLYRVEMNSNAVATPVGGLGALGVNISAIAAWGNPARLYGLGNGLLSDDGPVDNRSLYEIDTQTGTVTLIGTIGPAASEYLQAGLSFDEEGTLWAITDRRIALSSQGSQILTLDTETGQGTLIATTTVTGFESLAVAPPGGCQPDDPGPGEPGDVSEPIPSLGLAGRLAAIFVLLGFGAAWLRRRSGR